MLTRRGTLPDDQSRWAFEVDWEGERAVARSLAGRFQLFDAGGTDITAKFPELRLLNRALGARAAIIDGTVVVLDGSGRPNAAALRERLDQHGETAIRRAADVTPVTFMAVDLLWGDGHELLDLTYVKRRERLTALKLEGERWQTPRHFAGEGDALLAAAREQGLRGILAKRLESIYAPGRRTGDWLAISR